MMNSDKDSVQVAVRIRPLIESEISQGCKNVLEVYSDLNQIRIKDSNNAFTFNHVYDTDTTQDLFYNTCIKELLDNLFKGYNLTILAYGQTGSGKTFSMGTSYNGNGEMGVIPRAVNDIFAYVNDHFTYDFSITVSFMELYQEVLYDLLSEKPREQCALEIREDSKGIIIPGLTEILVTSATSTMAFLAKGSSLRATASTNMNTQSSRSHAIFTINISMQKKGDVNSNKTAKFHLVDLAGSERSKKTGATGQIFKEAVNINKGLLALGNVISALGDEKLQNGYICYRESNLTRLLKDSLGGNSITFMVCCVSPADYNYQETVSTLRYADRARKIRNKPVINQDPKAAEINRLNKLVQQLRLELVGQGGSVICHAELEQIKRELETLKCKNRELTLQLSGTLTEKTALYECIILMQTANEQMNRKLHELKDEYNITVSYLSQTIDENDPDAIKEHIKKLHDIEGMFSDLNTQLTKNEEEIRQHELCAGLTKVNNVDAHLETELSAEQENHMKKQVAINSEIQEVTKMLAMKEHIAQKMLANSHHLVNYTSIVENESKVALLEKEKEELLKQLKDVHSGGVTNKIAEQRRVRVTELEKQIHELQRKINEQARLIKLKEKDEQKIKLLNNEIREMKQTKVKLIKTMKLDSDQFNSWKSQRERELIKLKEQDRKRQNQIVKMETVHSRQQNVLRRKVEEAAALNKRLKDTLALRKNIQDQRNTGKVERLLPWVQQELDIVVHTIDAEGAITNLLDERTTLHKQLDEMKSNPEKCDIEEIKQLEEDIEVRSIQIRDLQQKILDSDQENKGKLRWDNIQSMADAKFALKTLFDLTTETRLKDLANQQKISDLQNCQYEVNRKLNEQHDSIKMIKAQHKQNLSELNKDYEEKICLLLKQLRGIKVEGVEEQLQQQCDIQQEALEQLDMEKEELKQQNQKYSEEINNLRRNMDEINNQLQLQPVKKKKNSSSSLLKRPVTFLSNEENDTELDASVDDPMDPDWHKTPLARKLRKLRNTSIITGSEHSRLTVKRSSDGSCACRGDCSRRHCGCRKVSQFCTTSCKCPSEKCLNKNAEKENAEKENITVKTNLTFSEDEGDSEDSSKRIRTLCESNSTIEEDLSRKRKTGKSLFHMNVN